jgi:hypothetical protein
MQRAFWANSKQIFIKFEIVATATNFAHACSTPVYRAFADCRHGYRTGKNCLQLACALQDSNRNFTMTGKWPTNRPQGGVGGVDNMPGL